MARPVKMGIDYFPFDVNNDVKLDSLVRKFGAIGFGSFIGLLQKIYKEGYYLEYDEDFKEDFCAEFDIDESFFDKFLSFLLRRNFLNPVLFEDEEILTSRGIQKRYIEATKRRKESAITRFNLIEIKSGKVTDNSNSINERNNSKKKKKESLLDPNTDYPFELWWNMYDKKVGKPKCEKKYEKLSEKVRVEIFNHTEKYISAQPDKKYRKNPETYLNQQSWQDEIISNSNESKQQTFSEKAMVRQSTKGIATAKQIEEASKNDNITDEDLF